MRQYLDLLQHIKNNGYSKGDRTGTGTISTFGYQTRFDLQKGFPLVTTKEVSLKNIVTELIWFFSGNTNIKYLKEHGCKIWDAWATENGDLGPIYGHQWRNWTSEKYGSIDQIQECINLLKTKPDSRRIIVSAWNPEDLPDESISPQENVLKGNMALAACHTLFQFYTRELTTQEKREFLWMSNPPKRFLSCQIYIRSNDVFLGAPYNIASYALITEIMAKEVGMIPKELVYTIGDAHLYSNHLEQVDLQLSREPYPLPKLNIVDYKGLDNLTHDNFELVDYKSHSRIKAPIAV